MRYSIAFIITLLLFALSGTLHAQSVSVVAPNGGEKYEMAQPVTVVWSSAGVATLRLEY
jgi:hypothetical protein